MKIGYNKLDVTPNSPSYQSGYNRDKRSDGVLDPIEINTLIMKINDKKIILCLIDSIIIKEEFVAKIKDVISLSISIPKSSITIGCTHTHSGPAFFNPFFENVTVEKDLIKTLEKQVIQSILKANDDLEECTVQMSVDEISGVYGNRNNKENYANKKIINLFFYNKLGNLKFVFGNLACHPTILKDDNFKLSADLIGWLRKKMSLKYSCPIMLSNSYAGDVSTRFYRTNSDYFELDKVSEEILEQLKVKPKRLSLHNLEITSVNMSFSLDSKTDLDHKVMREKIEDELLSTSSKKNSHPQHQLLNILDIKDLRSPLQVNLISNIYSFDDIIFITLPGDVTSELGRKLEEELYPKRVLIIGYTETDASYLVSSEEYGLYFESFITRIAKGNADLFIAEILKEIKKLS